MVEAQTLIAVRNVRASSRWYAELLAADSLAEHEHRDFYDRILSQKADAARPGHGVVLWFQVDDFHSAVARARNLGAEILQEPDVNPAPQHWEIWLRDPDGYVVVVCSPDGDCG